MRLARALDDKKFDVRLRDKLVADKKLAYDEVETYITNLPDDTTVATTTDDVNRRYTGEGRTQG